MMLTNELENTLQNLRCKHVDISIRENAVALEKSTRENTPPGGGDLSGGKRGLEFDFIEKDYNNKIEEKITLYDYVEEQSVQELKDKTREEVSAIVVNDCLFCLLFFVIFFFFCVRYLLTKTYC